MCVLSRTKISHTRTLLGYSISVGNRLQSTCRIRLSLCFFQLPHAWLLAFLSEWMSMKDIGLLDTAMTSKKYRPYFLRGLQCMRSTSIDRHSQAVAYKCHVTDNSPRAREVSGWWFRWLYVRNVHVERVTVAGSVIHSVMMIPSIRELGVMDCSDQSFLNIIQSCPTIRTLTTCRMDVDQPQ